MDPIPFTQRDIDTSIPERFAKVTAAGPDRLAIAAGSERLTYAELDRRSSRIAAAITRGAPAGEAPVAVLLSDPVAAVVGMLATWKAAKLCVPLDPSIPHARLEVILRDAEAGLIVTDRSGGAAVERLTGVPARRIHIDELDVSSSSEVPRPAADASTPACLLYTSGSTGEPKGLVRSHRNMLHRARCAVHSLAVRPGDRVSALHTPMFGAGLRDVTTALLGGAALFPFDLRRAGLGALAGWIDRDEISVLCSVVTTFRHLIADLEPERRFGSVRVVRLGSEPLYRQDVEQFRRHFSPACVLVAGYGASEASGIVELVIRHDTQLAAGRVPAGYALDGVEILVLDDDGRPVEAGQPGEVTVRSRYLSDGYWRRPDLTQATFRRDPLDHETRIYRTGDIGWQRPDGCLELLGRKDHQVKVRGYRVHPGQIEAALTEHEAVREAVVTASPDAAGDAHLVAYVVAATTPPPSPEALRRFLQSRLPTYLIPSTFMTLDAMPINANGKLDRAALPPPPSRASRLGELVVPRNPVEHQIAGIWEDLFGIAPIGANDDFFDLGGDSLLAAALVSAIEEICGRALAPAALLDAPTVGALAAALLRDDRGFDQPLSALRTSGARPPLFFVHNDHGRGLYTHALARALDPGRPMYAVHLHGLAARALPATVEAIAADRLEAVRAARPHGPYVLGGHCYGGIVALEMARQLQEAGERVEAVVMIDARAPGRRARTLHSASAALGRVGGFSPAARAALVAVVDRAAEEIVGRTRSYRSRLGALAGAGGRHQARAVGRHLGWAARRIARAAGGGHGPVFHSAPSDAAMAWQAYRRAIRRYVPGAYEGVVALFRAEMFPAERPDLGWADLLPGLQIEVVPGDHHTCITRHVSALAARLENILGSADKSAP